MKQVFGYDTTTAAVGALRGSSSWTRKPSRACPSTLESSRRLSIHAPEDAPFPRQAARRYIERNYPAAVARRDRLIWCAVALAALVACSGGGTSLDTNASATLFTATTVFDGARFLENQGVLVRGGLIVAIDDEDGFRGDPAEVIDLGDATLLPGFIDLHVHTGALGAYKELVNEGVTTVRDLGISEDLLPFPDSSPLKVVVAGPLITAPGGYPIPVHGDRVGGPVEGVTEARSMVARLADKGAGVIKVSITRGPGDWPVLSGKELRAIVEEAHDHDLRVTAHVYDRNGVERALAAGVDELAHMPCAGNLDRDLWERVAEAEMAIVGTLHVLEDSCDAVTPARRFLRAGGELLYGSDAGNPGIPFGIDIAELELMMQAGLSLEEVLTAATSRAGEQLGIPGLGSMSTGAPADLIAVRGDLRTDLHALEDPLLVMADGEVVIDER